MSIKSGDLKPKISDIKATLQDLEDNLHVSRDYERKILLSFHMDNLKAKGLANQLEEARRENKQLLNVLQHRCGDNDLSNNNSKYDMSSSCSTMSMVHLQYKYEELLANHNGLLKILENKLNDTQKINDENELLKQQLEMYKMKLLDCGEEMSNLNARLANLQEQDNTELETLKLEKETLKSAHNQLVSLLHKQCMERDHFLSAEIKESLIPERALLLKEVQKTNLLTFDNVQLRQENDYLKHLLKGGYCIYDKDKRCADENVQFTN